MSKLSISGYYTPHMVKLADIEALPDSSLSTLKKRPLKSYTSSRLGYSPDIPEEDYRSVKEQVIQREITNFLKSRGAWVVKFPTSQIVGGSTIVGNANGAPDLLACYRGRFLGIEVKAARKENVKVSGEQVAQGRAIQRAGGFFLVAWKVSQVEELLKSVDAVL